MAINKRGRLGSRGWKIDFDYINQLSDKEKEFLNSFTEEYYIANFNHDGKKLHKTKEQRREVYRANNASNRCTMSLSGVKTLRSEAVSGLLHVLVDYTTQVNPEGYENAMIEVLDMHAATSSVETKSQESSEQTQPPQPTPKLS